MSIFGKKEPIATKKKYTATISDGVKKYVVTNSNIQTVCDNAIWYVRGSMVNLPCKIEIKIV